MSRVRLSGVIGVGADDAFGLVVASAIEIDAVVYCASALSCFVCRDHTTHHYGVDSRCDGDVDAAARGIVPPRYPRYCSGHRAACDGIRCFDSLHRHLVSTVCFHRLAVDDASPDLQFRSAAASNGDLRPLIHHLSPSTLLFAPH